MSRTPLSRLSSIIGIVIFVKKSSVSSRRLICWSALHGNYQLLGLANEQVTSPLVQLTRWKTCIKSLRAFISTAADNLVTAPS